MKTIAISVVLLLVGSGIFCNAQPAVSFGQELETKNLGGAMNIILHTTSEGYYVLRMEGVAEDDAQMALLQDNPGTGAAMALAIGYGVCTDDHRLYEIESYMGNNNANMFAKSKFFIQYYDKNCNQQYSKQFTIMDGESQMRLKNILWVNNRLVAFASSYDKKNYITTLYAVPFNADGSLSNEKIKLDEVSGKNSAFTNITNSYKVIGNADNSKLLVYYHTNLPTKMKAESFTVKMLDANFKEQWQSKYLLNMPDNNYAITRQYIIGEYSYVLLKVQANAADKDKGAKAFSFQLIKSGKDIKESMKLEIGVTGKLVTDIYIDEKENNEINVFGFYSDKGAAKAGGVYVYTINKEFVLSKKSFKDFTPAVIESILGDDADDKPELGNIHIRAAYKNNNDSYTLLTENFSIVTSSNSGGSMNFSYRYTNIPIFNIKEDASVAWSGVVTKKQVSSNDGARYLSFAHQRAGDNIYLILNGNKKDISQRMANKDNAMVYIVKINGAGEISTNPLFSTKEIDTTLLPKTTKKFDDRNLLFMSNDGLKYRFGKITL
jgi:hypothetical protein